MITEKYNRAHHTMIGDTMMGTYHPAKTINTLTGEDKDLIIAGLEEEISELKLDVTMLETDIDFHKHLLKTQTENYELMYGMYVQATGRKVTEKQVL